MTNECQLLETAVASLEPSQPVGRISVKGKFLFAGDQKFLVKGVTYGAFKPDETGNEYHDLDKIDRDFAAMAASGMNTVRIPHTMPPRDLLDIAGRHDLKVMVGLSAEQYVGHLLDRNGKGPDVAELVRQKVRTVAGHPALLCYALGNEIPAPMVRWLGPARVERYLHDIFRAARSEDPAGLITYVNYPTTEYLRLPFLDLSCFNVYLESPKLLGAYLARLQNLVGDIPLLMSEVGLDSLRNGEQKQADVLEWQIQTVFAAGCAGAVIFSWTDEWFRAGEFVGDWAFGLTDTQRRPRPALKSVQTAFGDVPFGPLPQATRFSVIVCTHNGARTLRDCLDALTQLAYPNYEVIVVNDGSTDETPRIAGEYEFRLITTENLGLSNARNLGLNAATGAIVVYIDDDAYPDRDWLSYLAHSFDHSSHVGIGGPNLDPPGDGFIAECVANAPGGPVHVLLTDEIAEHIPGCNMAFRKEALQAIGGFDTRFRVAGDDVDVCWRLQQRGWTLGYNPAATVWHHSRNSIRTYWRQQRGYGKAEALLEAKWPAKYNSAGHHTFQGKIYGKGFGHVLGLRQRVYHGIWGSAPFQGLHHQAPGILLSLPTMPEWYLVIGFLALLVFLGLSWPPLLATFPLLILAMALSVMQALRGARRASFHTPANGSSLTTRLRLVTAFLHLMQPLARLVGRVGHGLVFWRQRGTSGIAFPRRKEFATWTEDWTEPTERVNDILNELQSNRAIVVCGDEYARWDLEVRGGMFGAARLLMAVEDHGAGAQYVRIRAWPHHRPAARVAPLIFAILAYLAITGGGWAAAGSFAGLLALVTLWTIKQSGTAMTQLLKVIEPPAAP